METRPLVTPDWLFEHREDPELVVVDCRFELADPEAGERAYRQSHLPGARYLDLEKDLSGPVGKHGGRHPLPDREAFAETLGRRGIDESKLVIAYDAQGGAMAARLWWMLHYLGHPEVAVLDGGYQGWVEKGYPVTADMPQPLPVRFRPRIESEMLVGVDEVKKHVGLLIDSRDPDRFAGRDEPIDAKAGHIPGAVNRFWKENLKEDGSWKSVEELKKEWAFAFEDEAPIVYCGSGVTACANLLALHAAGHRGARLYAGSWSDWITYRENPVQTESSKR